MVRSFRAHSRDYVSETIAERCRWAAAAVGAYQSDRLLDPARATQRLVFREDGLLEQVFSGRDHRCAQSPQQRALSGGARLMSLRRERNPRIFPAHGFTM